MSQSHALNGVNTLADQHRDKCARAHTHAHSRTYTQARANMNGCSENGPMGERARGNGALGKRAEAPPCVIRNEALKENQSILELRLCVEPHP